MLEDIKNSVFDMFIDKDVLTLEELESVGVTNNIFPFLEGVVSVGNNQYKLGNNRGLQSYANRLYRLGKYDRQQDALRRALDVFPNDISSASLLFSYSISSSSYDEAFKYFDIISNTKNRYYSKDQNLWLLLLSYLTDIPEKYENKVDNLLLDDVLVLASDTRYDDIDIINEIRTAIYEKKFIKALKLFNNSGIDDTRMVNFTTRKLLEAVVEKEYRNSDDLYYDLIVDDDYNELILILENKGLDNLDVYEKCLYYLAKDMIWMNLYGRVPKAKDCLSLDLEEAVVKHNYEFSLQLYNVYKNKGELVSNEALTLLLQKAALGVDKIKLIREAIQIGSEDFSRLFNSLSSGNIDEAKDSVGAYLKKMDKLQYKDYVIALINLGVLENDPFYIEAMLTMSAIKQGVDSFDVTLYIQDFYSALSDNNVEMAMAYLDIISCSSDIGGVLIDTLEFKNRLKDFLGEKELASLKENEKVLVTSKDVCLSSVGEDLASTLQQDFNSKDILDIKPERNAEELATKYGFLSGIIEEINNGDNVVLLEPMTNLDADNIFYMVSCVPNLEVSLIDSTDGINKHIMIRYRDKDFSNSIRDLMESSKKAYYEKRYDDCIECLEPCICSGNPKSYVYARLGLAYRALGTDFGYRNAIDYLTIATSKSKNDYDGDFDFTVMVEKLKSMTGYNGVKAISDTPTTCEKSEGISYTKKNENN